MTLGEQLQAATCKKGLQVRQAISAQVAERHLESKDRKKK